MSPKTYYFPSTVSLMQLLRPRVQKMCTRTAYSTAQGYAYMRSLFDNDCILSEKRATPTCKLMNSLPCS